VWLDRLNNPLASGLWARRSAALNVAVGRLRLPAELRDHCLELFQAFLKRERVVEELTQIIDPRPDSFLNLDLLRSEFESAGFDPDSIGFADVIQGFISSFYDSAAAKEELQGAIEIALLRQIAASSGVQIALMERQTTASEASASQMSELVNLAEQLAAGQVQIQAFLGTVHEQLGDTAPGRAFDVYQQLAAGLGKRGIYISFDSGSRLSIGIAGDLDAALDLAPLRALLDELRGMISLSGRPPAHAELAAREQRYRELINRSFSNLRLEGLSTGVRPISLPLEKVYVQLRAVSEVPEGADVFSPEERSLLRLIEGEGREEEIREAQLQMDALRRERWTRERVERFPIAEALQDPRSRGLVILGDPGSGKSTLLQFLALVFGRGPESVRKHLDLVESDVDRLPIFAPLAAYDEMLNEEPELTVQEFLGRYYDRRRAAPGLEPVFAAALEKGGALVLLDGLDEVVLENRRRFVAEQVSAFIREAMLGGNRILLTSRIYGYRAAPLSVELPHVTVLDFRREEIEVFARQWSQAMSAWDAGGLVTPQTELLAQADERSLLEQVRSNPGVAQLAVNPLLLTMLALLRRQVGGLPERRIQLYDLYVRALVQNWEENRSRGARLAAPKRADALEAETVLIPLSLWLQQNKPSGTATRGELLSQLLGIFLRDAGESGRRLLCQMMCAFWRSAAPTSS
jgi:hypothetical protein